MAWQVYQVPEILISFLALIQETIRGVYDEFSGFQVLTVLKIITVFLAFYVIGKEVSKPLFTVPSNHCDF